jgi:signal peptidase II
LSAEPIVAKGNEVKKKLCLIPGVLLLVALDLGTKWWAAKTLQYTAGKNVVNGFWRFDYVENRNVAFSLGKSIPDNIKQPLIIGVALLALCFLIYYLIKVNATALTMASATVILSGALGNLVDRLVNGYVVDFIHWYCGSFHWPVFNLADVYIVIGMGLLIIEYILFAKEEKEKGTKKR